MNILKSIIKFLSIVLLANNVFAQELTDIKNSKNKRLSVFVGIGKSNQLFMASNKSPSYQFGISKKIRLSKQFNLNNELSIIRFPFEYNSMSGNYNNNYYYLNYSTVPEIIITKSFFIGASPSINYFFSPSNPYLNLFDESKILSIGGNSYIGISLENIILKFRYNINSIDSKRVGPFIGLNIEYNL